MVAAERHQLHLIEGSDFRMPAISEKQFEMNCVLDVHSI